MKVVIFAAGESTRTAPLTVTRPKPLLPVLNKPILAHQLEALAGTVDEAIVVVGYRNDMIRRAFKQEYAGIRLRYALQEERRGTGHALLTVAQAIREPFLAMNGDDLYAAEDIAALADTRTGALAKRMNNPTMYGVFELDSDGKPTGLVEKPENPPSDLANTGVYKLTPDVFSILEATELSDRGEIEITSAIRAMMAMGTFKFQVIECRGHWLPIGYPWDLIRANEWLLRNRFEPVLEGEVHPAAHVTGPVHIGRGTVVRAGVVIDGPVYIGEDCTIGPNAWIRPGTTIGNNCKVGQSVELKNSILFEGARVPHLSYAGDSVIGAGANLGCGTITANFRHDGGNHRSMVKGDLVDTGMRKLGAIIGDDVHTGINTSIYPGRKLWPGTSTLPGEVVQRDKEA